MKIVLVTPDGKRHAAALPYEGAHYVAVKDWACTCGVNHAWGMAAPTHGYDTLRSEAACPKCGAPVGVLEATVETIFGIDEDRAVMARARVYG